MPCRTGSRWTPSRLNSRSAKLSCGLRVRLISGSGLALVLGRDQLGVEFTDALRGGLQLMVVAHRSLDERLLFGRVADLLGASSGVAAGQYPGSVHLTG